MDLATIKKGHTVLVKVRITGTNRPTYLSDGLYNATRGPREIHFRNAVTGTGTFEPLLMLAIFQRRGWLSIERKGDNQPCQTSTKLLQSK
jgi:hypothetical protein